MAKPGSGAAFQPASPGAAPASPRVRYGTGGLAFHPLTPNESPVIQNMVVGRDGVWRPRQGLAARATFSSDIHHVSERPWKDGDVGYAGKRIVVMEGTAWGSLSQNLWLVSHTDYSTTNLDSSNYGNSFFYQPPAFGTDGATEHYWIMPCLAAFGDGAGHPGDLYRIDKGGTLDVLDAGAPQAIWVEPFGNYTFALDRDLLYYTGASDSTSWDTANKVLKLPPEIGQASAFLSTGFNQGLLFGTLGISFFSGATPSQFRLEPRFKIGALQFSCITRVGPSEVIILGAGQVLYRVTPQSMTRISDPIHWALWNANPNNLRAWFDPMMNYYLIADSGAERTLVYDLTRGVWLGTIDKALVGQATIYDDVTVPFVRRFVGLGDTLCEWQDGLYTDAGTVDPFECKLHTPPTVLGGPDQEKQLDRLWVDCAGVWIVSLFYRDQVGDPDDNWSQYFLGVLSGPGWVYGPTEIFKEFKLELMAPADQGVFLREIVAEVNVRGGSGGGGPLRVPLVIPAVAGPGSGFGYGTTQV